MYAALLAPGGPSRGGSPREVTGKFCAFDFSMDRISLLRSDSDPFENDFVYIRKEVMFST